MMKIALQIQILFHKKGYRFFDSPMPYNLNIVGIRSSNRIADKFDDHIGVMYYDPKMVWQEYWWPATVDSGSFYLRQPLNKNGTAVLVAGQYRGAYKIGIHGRTWASGGYEALEQVSEMRYIRDNNRDNIIDLNGEQFNAILKTNIHRAYPNKIAEFVGKYSAGCQVFQNPEDFNMFMDICKKSFYFGYPNSFTYTLINERDLQ